MPSGEKVSVTLSGAMAREVREAVAKGEFSSASEAPRDAVRLWQRHRLEDVERIETLRARLRRSLDDPREDLDESEVERRLANLHAETAKAHRGAKA